MAYSSPNVNFSLPTQCRFSIFASIKLGYIPPIETALTATDKYAEMSDDSPEGNVRMKTSVQHPEVVQTPVLVTYRVTELFNINAQEGQAHQKIFSMAREVAGLELIGCSTSL